MQLHPKENYIIKPLSTPIKNTNKILTFGIELLTINYKQIHKKNYIFFLIYYS